MTQNEIQNEVVVSGTKFEVFSNSDFSSIRTQLIKGEPWFVGKDVATALGYKESQKAVRDHVDPEDKGVSKIDTPGGVQELVVVNESGVYSLTFASKLPKAKQFKRWITSEVLPALRKTGTYSVINPLEQPLSREEMAMYWTNLMASYKDYSSILERRDKSRDEKLDTLIEAQTKCYSYLSDCVKTMSCFVELVRNGNLNNTTSIVTTSKPKETATKKVSMIKANKTTRRNSEATSWAKDAALLVKELSKSSGIDIRLQSREVYDVMRSHGYKVVFKPGVNTITTISKSKKLREGFSFAMESLKNKYSTKHNNVPQSIIVRKVPADIKDKILEYANLRKISYPSACVEIYKKIENISNVDLNKMRNDYAHRLGFTSCSKAYMISNNNVLLDLFNKVIKEA